MILSRRYELAYIESRAAGVARGQRVWQLAFGSGFKFNSCVLVANRRLQETHSAWQNFDSQVSTVGIRAALYALVPSSVSCLLSRVLYTLQRLPDRAVSGCKFLMSFAYRIVCWCAAHLQAMWRELDALDAAVSAERAARAKLNGKESH